MEIYKVQLVDYGSKKQPPPFYFKQKKTAKAIKKFFGDIRKENDNMSWDFEIITVYDHDEAYRLLMKEVLRTKK